MDKERLHNFLKTLGPGILFASTAIGVSHLVQSTRAGANFGFMLVPVILAANVFKYPFFEYGSRYANATGESLIDGYKRVGKWMLWLYFLITIGSMFFVCAAVGAVTSGFLQNLFGLTEWGTEATIALFVICSGILLLGKYKILDSLVKVIGFVLLISVILAFVLALFKGANEQVPGFKAPDLWTEGSLVFIIALMGWMPTAVDLSAWTSLWTIERIKQTGYRPTLNESLGDFNFGYIISAILAICFVTLGAFMLFGTGTKIPDGSSAFAHSVIGMFTNFIGDWSYIIIAAAAFSIMFGTCIAVFDGYSRSIERVVALLVSDSDHSIKSEDLNDNPRELSDVEGVIDGQMEAVVSQSSNESTKPNFGAYSIALLVVVIGSFSLVFFFGKHMKSLVDLAMTISFLIAPVIAIVNFRLVTGKYVADEFKPKLWLQILSWMGILFLVGFALFYAWMKFVS